MNRKILSIIFFGGFITCYFVTNFVYVCKTDSMEILKPDTYAAQAILIACIHAIFLNTFSNDIKTTEK